jgi:hypothetical protein
MSPPSGLATVAINARPILPQQGQQQRKISGGRTLGEYGDDDNDNLYMVDKRDLGNSIYLLFSMYYLPQQ